MEGWIKVHRKIQKHWVWSNDAYLKAWLTILMTVNHDDKKALISGQLIECKRGQSILSLQSWVNTFSGKWTIQKVRTFFSLLQADKMIDIEGLTKTTRLTVCNYNSYNDKQHTNNTQTTDTQHTNNTQTTHKQHAANMLLTTTKECKEREELKEGKEREEKEGSLSVFRLLALSILDYFGFNEITNPDKISVVATAIRVLRETNMLEKFEANLEGYKRIRPKGDKYIGKLASFLGSEQNNYLDGRWNDKNWSEEVAPIVPEIVDLSNLKIPEYHG